MPPLVVKPSCPLCAVVSRASAGEAHDAGAGPLVVASLEHTVAILGDNQGCAGWCVCLLREHVEHLDELDERVQREVFGEVARVARAIRRVFPTSGAGGGPPRINYECLGNVQPHVHWHVIPRHADDPTPRAPVWGWSEAALAGSASPAARAKLAATLRGAI